MRHRPRYLLLLSLLSIVVLSVVGCGATPMDTVDTSLLGTWHGEATVRPPISFKPPPKETPRPPEVTVKLNITINDDASVTGTVGGAELKNCVLKQNRGDLGRQLNVASDYIIMDGYLDGSIIPGDQVYHKDFTIPFDVVDDRMQGSIMWVQGWKYPSPLMRVDLVHAQ